MEVLQPSEGVVLQRALLRSCLQHHDSLNAIYACRLALRVALPLASRCQAAAPDKNAHCIQAAALLLDNV